MIDNERYREFADAIVLQAVSDYREALGGKKVGGKDPELTIRECENFFRSDRYRVLTTIDGEYLIDNIRKEFIH